MQVESIRVATPEEMDTLGSRMAAHIQPGDWVFLQGALGAGKSVLVRALVRTLGACDWHGSPTFTLVNEYDTDPPVRHVDLYRLVAADIADMGLEDVGDPRTVTVVEWSDRGEDELARLAGTRIWLIEIAYVGLSERDVTIVSPRQEIVE